MGALLLKHKIAMLVEIRRVRRLTPSELSELKNYREDLEGCSEAAYIAGDIEWQHEVCGLLEVADSILREVLEGDDETEH